VTSVRVLFELPITRMQFLSSTSCFAIRAASSVEPRSSIILMSIFFPSRVSIYAFPLA